MAEKNNEDLKKEMKDVKAEVEALKKIFILYLIKMGTTSEEIGQALGLDGSRVRRMVPSRGIKKFKGM